MNAAPWMICKTFLESSSPQEQKRLFSFLPKNIQERFSLFPSIEVNPQRKSTDQQALLFKMHYAWMAPLLRNFSENDLRLCLSALNQDQIKGLEKRLRFADHTIKLSPIAASYIQNYLLQQLSKDIKDLLPFHFLPRTSLSPLLDLSYSQFQTLFSLLGLFDLSFALKQIIDTARLKHIYQGLTSAQQAFLSSLQLPKSFFAPKPHFLDGWDNDPKSLPQLIDERGIHRFALALSGQDSSFVWYLTHFMDPAFAQKIKTQLIPLESSKTLEMLQQQVLQTVSTMKQPG